MIAEAILVIFTTAAGAALTQAVERALLRGEPGPAAQMSTARGRDLPNADRWLLPIGPFIAMAGVLLAAVVIPFGAGLVGADLGIGVFYFIVVVDFVVLGIALAGWGANTADTVEAFYRVVAQLVAYVVPLGLAIVGVIMMAGSLSTVRIVEAQSAHWFILSQPLGFALYLIAGAMQSYRAPFAEPFAPGIGGGVLAVAGGWMALVWRFTLSALLWVVAAMGAVLFLGGWQGVWLPGPIWMSVKTFLMMALMLGLGRLLRPLSMEGTLALSWKVLTPVGLANVLVVGGLILFGIGRP